MVVALASLCAVPIEVVDRLMGGDRPDPILILCKSRLGLADRRAIIMARPGGQGASSQGLDTAYANFERLSPATAQRVMRFWQVRPTTLEQRRGISTCRLMTAKSLSSRYRSFALRKIR